MKSNFPSVVIFTVTFLSLTLHHRASCFETDINYNISTESFSEKELNAKTISSGKGFEKTLAAQF